jgi:hypothetical protein
MFKLMTRDAELAKALNANSPSDRVEAAPELQPEFK